MKCPIDFNTPVTCYMDMLDKWVKIDGSIFFCKRLNEFADAVLLKDGINDTMNIANLKAAGKKVVLCFMYHGIHCKQNVYLKHIKQADK